MKILKSEQTEKIKQKKLDSRKIDHLLNVVIELSAEQQERFLLALKECNQKHVVKYILSNGIRYDEYGGDWPVMYTTMYDAVEENRQIVIEILDTRLGLLQKLLSIGCINKRQKETVEVGQTSAIKNESLLLVVGRKSVADYKRFIQCLVATKQRRAASLLAPEIVGKVQPISQSQCLRLRFNYDLLIELIDSTNGLTTEMYASDCITRRQKEFIELAASPSESSTRILDIVERGGQKDLNKFIECLDKTAQHHVSRILLEDGIVVPIDVKTSGGEHFQQNETLIVDLFKLISVENKPEAVKIVRQLLKNNDVDLLTMNTKHSIRLFLFCKSYCGLQHLHEQYHSSRHLSEDVMTFFRSLLIDNDHSPDIDLHIDRLVWDTSNYTNGVTYFHRVNNLQVFSRIHQLAQQSRDAATGDEISGVISIDPMPFELLERILMRATVQLYRAINRSSARAEVYTLATLSAVSRKWRRIYDESNKRLLRRYLRYVSQPYRCRVRHENSFNVDDAHDVRGVVEFNGELYVICEKSNAVSVFTSGPHFRKLQEIEVHGLGSPRDIVVCRMTSRLYIADSLKYVIWRVNLLSNRQADRFVTIPWPPGTLSVESTRLLVTLNDLLLLYGDDGKELSAVELPGNMLAHHAIETVRRTYLVSHASNNDDDNKCGVSELDDVGRVIRSFNNRHYVIHELYLVLDNGHVIAAEHHNRSIIVLNSKLELIRVLMTSLGGQPRRMCLSASRDLFVSFYDSTRIDIVHI